MSGQGKYTKYAPPASDKNVRLAKLFAGNSKEENPLAGLVGKEDDARLTTVARAKAYLTPKHQAGDVGLFPNGVNLDFTGDTQSPPNFEDVKWQKAGDPALPYAPDVRSPGPGVTSAEVSEILQSKPTDTVADVVGDGYVPGAPGTSTKSPAQTTPAIARSNDLGQGNKLGSSS